MRSSITDQERASVAVLRDILARCREINPRMTLQQLSAFLEVAYEEGQPVTNYAQRLGIAQGVMSRHLFDLGEYDRDREPGLGLVEQRNNLQDRRAHQTHLTTRGLSFVRKVHAALSKLGK